MCLLIIEFISSYSHQQARNQLQAVMPIHKPSADCVVELIDGWKNVFGDILTGWALWYGINVVQKIPICALALDFLTPFSSEIRLFDEDSISYNSKYSNPDRSFLWQYFVY